LYFIWPEGKKLTSKIFCSSLYDIRLKHKRERINKELDDEIEKFICENKLSKEDVKSKFFVYYAFKINFKPFFIGYYGYQEFFYLTNSEVAEDLLKKFFK